ncbi:hypothetical protein [Sulfuritalea sp.]|uniref:hypothetical protein n=1 Tax=Sulfuritalea sp. TaxID=2480090 RepID=UPI001AC0768C|nr:hypothetical protein [Sulfuritalea sp.]MBN8475605.1 hypothetical protein [Sulfuritalea sp.]
MGRLFWKVFLAFRPAHVVTSLGVGVAIWALRPTRFDAGVDDGRMESLDLGEPVGGIAEDVGVEAEALGVDLRPRPGHCEKRHAAASGNGRGRQLFRWRACRQPLPAARLNGKVGAGGTAIIIGRVKYPG